jgi:circadian clock protein KaiC
MKDRSMSRRGRKTTLTKGVRKSPAGIKSLDEIIRAELHRLFRWLKDQRVTTIITAERGGAFTRHGLEEYVSECVILLDHRVSDQVSMRRLRMVTYRRSVHGTNEYPFLIDHDGGVVLPITSVALDHQASTALAGRVRGRRRSLNRTMNQEDKREQ